jgi:hypothetical protein
MTMLYQIIFSKLKVSTSTGSDCEPMRRIAYSKMNTSILTTTTEFKQEQNGTPFGKRNQFVAVMSIITTSKLVVCKAESEPTGSTPRRGTEI